MMGKLILRKTFLAFALYLGFSALNASAQTIAVTHCNGACPSYESTAAIRNSRTVIHHVYSAGLNSQTGLADWVAYRLTPDAIGVASLLSRTWQPDRLLALATELEIIETAESQASLASISVQDNPYAGMSEPPAQAQDRARLAPITSFANTPYWSDLNNISNMVPMPASLRLGPWLRLEQALNALAVKQGELYVISGPLFLITSPLNANLNAAEINPSAYFKVIVADREMATFVFPANLSQNTSYCEQSTVLGDVESMSGLILFPETSPVESSALKRKLGCQP